MIMLLTTSLYSETLYTFSDVSVNYLDWTHTTETKTSQTDFGYFTLEGGARWNWGEFYGNINLENPNKEYKEEDDNSQRYTAFGDFDVSLKDGWRIHFQNFYLNSDSFCVNDFVVGGGYKFQNQQGFWIRPFIGAHFTNDTYYNGFNGYMTGWTFNYDFHLFDEKFSLFQWNEIEFMRAKNFYQDSDGNPTGDGSIWGLNGDISLWWHINKKFVAGMQYRYAQHKLGYIQYQSAIIYTLKYNF